MDSRQRSIGEAIRYWANLQPEHIAIVGSNLAPLSYRELQTQIYNVNIALRGYAFGRNARIIVALPDGAMAALATVGMVCSAVAVLLDPRLTIAEVEARYQILARKLFFCFTTSTRLLGLWRPSRVCRSSK